ncbi:MAG: ParB N-terminal domain-containing protein [Synechococcales cyanobacterium C42_A2020_086]|jgi:ParB family chromosome partitioning protein|nr:ParB N-terminal domain-containing protein [Synechococcales cyanobacterium M58_A2018_015]MBF2073299.1 ParB N-terminal domain-containing protein [Synechococcales cyanobacterium C42_A2020_086]
MPLVAINQVKIHTNRRPLKDQKVAELMESIKTSGLLNPITLDQNFNLIAGLHRLTACKLLGFDQIECNIVTCDNQDYARLAEIDENLIRNELEALERAELWLERDQILERMGLRAKAGDNQYTQRGGEMNSPPLKTTLELAKEIGYTERTFQQGKQIASQIAPKVKEAIRGTPVAKSPSALLRVARAGSKERKQAEIAEQIAAEAKRQRKQAELQAQAELAAAARAKQQELQLVALQSVAAEKAAKQATKTRRSKSTSNRTTTDLPLPNAQLGDEWVLDRHLVYCGDTSEASFIDLLPSDAALAIVNLAAPWNHDYLINEARVVVVICTEGQVHRYCRSHALPFQFEWILDPFYVAVCSHQSLLPPEKPVGLEGIEGLVAYLISLYSKPGNFVIAPFLGHGEVLIACERLGRLCFAGDPDPERLNRAIGRWQKLTSKRAERSTSSE